MTGIVERLRQFDRYDGHSYGQGFATARDVKAPHEAAVLIEELVEGLEQAIEIYECNYGRINPERFSEHWTITARALIAKVKGEVEAAMRDAICSGYPALANKQDQCKHGKSSGDDCIACYDEFLESRFDAAIDPASLIGGK